MDLPHSDDLSRHAEALHAFAAALCGSRHAADDVSQSVLAASLERPHAARGPLGPFLRGMAQRIAGRDRRNAARRSQREAQVARPERLPSAGDVAARLEIEERLIGYLRELPAPQYEAIYLRYWEGLAPREIAALKSLPVGTVKTRIKRGLEALRQRLTDTTTGGREAWLSALAGPLGAIGWRSAGVVVGGGIAMKKLLITVVVLAIGTAAWFSSRSVEIPAAQSADLRDVAEQTLALVSPAVVPDARQPIDNGSALGSVDAAAPAAPGGQRVIEGVVLNVASHDPTAPGYPAANVEVYLLWGMGISMEFPTTVTDESGHFRFVLQGEVETEDRVSVRALGSDRYAAASTRVLFDPGEPGQRDCEIRRYVTGTLHGQVVDVRGDPLAGITVRATAERAAPPRPPLTAVTDASGGFQFDAFDYDYKLDVVEGGWLPLRVDSSKRSDTGVWNDVRIVLARAAALTVRVVDADSNGIAGASVRVRPSNAERHGGEVFDRQRGTQRAPRETTGANGIARFDRVWTDHKLDLEVTHERQRFRIMRHPVGTSRAGRSIVARVGVEQRVLVVLGSSRRHVSGRVLGPSGEAVPGARVLLRSTNPAPESFWHFAAAAKCDDEGHFLLEFIGDGELKSGLLLGTNGDINMALYNTSTLGSAIVPMDRSSDDIVLRLGQGLALPMNQSRDGPTDCTVRVEVVPPPGVRVSRVSVQRAMLTRWPGRSPQLPSLPTIAELRAVGGYVQPGVYSGCSMGVEEGWLQLLIFDAKNLTATFGMEAGVGGVSIRAWDENRVALSSMGTGLRELAPGEYVLRFHLRAMGRLEGRLAEPLPADVDALHVALARPNGELLKLDVRLGRMGELLGIGATGSFVFDQVPEGSYELRIGDRDELQHGAARFRRDVSITAGKTTRVGAVSL